MININNTSPHTAFLLNTFRLGSTVLRKSCTLVCLLSMLFLSLDKVQAQQDFINGFYMFNPVAFNPAIVGANDKTEISAVWREQWTGLNGAPSTQYVNFHTPLNTWKNKFDRLSREKYNTGLSTGISILNDKIGATNFTKVSIPVGARIRLTESGIRMSLGLRFDVARFSANYLDLRYIDNEDIVSGSNPPSYNVNLATGLYVFHTHWYAGISMTNIRQNELENYAYSFKRHYYTSLGYAYPLTKEFTLRLTTLSTSVQGTPFSMTYTPAVIYDDLLQGGFSYRYGDMFGVFFSGKPIENLVIGYWYEYAIGTKRSSVGATHEIVMKLSLESLQLTNRNFSKKSSYSRKRSSSKKRKKSFTKKRKYRKSNNFFW